MPPRRKATVQKLSAHIDGSSADESEVGEGVVKKASTKRGKASGAAVKRAAPVARGKKMKAAEEPTEDESDPIEDEDEIEDIIVMAPTTKGRGGRKASETARKEPSGKKGGKKVAAKAADEGEGEGEQEEEVGEQTESEIPDHGEAKVVGRGKKKISTAAEKKQVPLVPAKKRMTKKEKDTAKEAEREVAETQFEPMEVDSPPGNYSKDDELEIAPTPTQVHRAGVTKVPAITTRGKGRSKRPAEPIVEEADIEGEDDLAKPKNPPTARGKKNPIKGDGKGGVEAYKDLEKAFQALQARYNNLQEAKETEAEQALKRFQKNMKEKDEERSKVIETLQSDLRAQQKAQQDLSAETKLLNKKLSLKETEISRLQTRVQELNKSLQDQQSESKVMSAKLVQAQNQLTQAQNQRNNAQVPGSAVKPGYRGPLGNQKASASGVVDHDAWLARVKEDLYSDLSGLIVVNVKKENDGNVFECVQTGVNGLAVHFKLSVPNRHVKAKKTQESQDPSNTEDIDENEIVFIPLFDETRDKTVIDLLPAYLRDEISFQRDHMTKFYQKINSLFMMTITTQQPGSTEEEGESEEEEDDDDEEE